MILRTAINIPEVVTEVRAIFDKYERALVSNDVEVLDALFRVAPDVVRYGTGENLYGTEEIRAFRKARSPAGLARTLRKTTICTFGTDFATVSTEYSRNDGWCGRQSQTWVKLEDGWKIVAAHVSQIAEPK